MRGLIALVGPTAVGKSKLALELAQAFSAEIVSADSRQVYRYLDIGTAKPTREERALVPHHLIDVVNPDEDFTLALYQERAYQAIADIQRRGKLPLLVGGSGLYVSSVLRGWRIPQVPPDPQLRGSLEVKARLEGGEVLYRELEKLDPQAAGSIHPRNLRRVIRALEVCYVAGKPFSQLRKADTIPFPTLTIGLTTSREDLYRRIDLRVEDMMERGWVGEVRTLLERGYHLNLSALSGVGYWEIGRFLLGEMDLPQAVERIKHRTHRFARHQYAWFPPSDERIHWFDIREELWERVQRLVGDFCQGQLQVA